MTGLFFIIFLVGAFGWLFVMLAKDFYWLYKTRGPKDWWPLIKVLLALLITLFLTCANLYFLCANLHLLSV